MELSTITSKGQTTIPAKIRHKLNLNTGDKLHFMIEDDHLIEVPAKRSIKDLKGIVPKPNQPVSIDDMNAAMLDEAAARMQSLS